MADESYLEFLSPELFENIISYTDEPQTLNLLCQTSRVIYNRVTPKLYHSWTYFGLEHSKKSFRTFIQTIIWRPDLAAHVRTLDIREWGNCPLLKDHVGLPWQNGGENDDSREGENLLTAEDREEKGRRREEKKRQKGEKEKDNWLTEDYCENTDDDYVFSDAQSDGSISSGYSSEYDAENMPESDFGPLEADQNVHIYQVLDSYGSTNRPIGALRKHWENAILNTETLTIEQTQILQTSAMNAGVGQHILIEYHEAIHQKNEFSLVALLLSKLTNLRTLYMVFTEPSWFSRHGEKAIQEMLEKPAQDEDSKVLQKLETLYICSALHIGAKGHREYHFDLPNLLPFMLLPNLKYIYTLQIHTYNDPYNIPPIEFGPYINSSNVKTLSFNEANIHPPDVFKILDVAKELEHFRWSQEISCFSIGSCYGPFYPDLGKALKKHKKALISLDLGIDHGFCQGLGHKGNLYTTLERRVGHDEPGQGYSGPQTEILIGSLQEFAALKILVIDASAICGHQEWAPASTQLGDALPPSLESLTLTIAVKRANERPITEFRNTLWPGNLSDLVARAETTHPYLKNISLEVMGRKWPEEEDIWMFRGIETACVEKGIRFSVRNPTRRVPTWLVERSADWNPGRDF